MSGATGIGTWVSRWAALQPDRPAILFDDTRLTWGEFGAVVDALASGLSGLGVTRGERVACLMSNRPEFLELFFAVQRLGAIFVPINVHLAPPELERTLRQTAPRAVVTSGPFAEVCEALRPRVDVRCWIGVDGPLAAGDTTFDALAATPPAAVDGPMTLDDPAAILYTSGTTGGPKGAVVTHANVAHMTLNWLVHAGISREERSLVFLPLCFTGGLLPMCMPTFHAGGTLVLQAGFDAGEALAAIERDRVTFVAGVPTSYRAMLEHPALADTDLSSLRLAVVGAAPVPRPLLRAWRDHGVPMLQLYGITEASGGMNLFLDPELADAKHGSCGAPTLYCDARLARDDGSQPAPGEVGELLLSGPLVMDGYWNDPDSTAATIRDGWLHTGDLASRDDDGVFTIVGRKKDLVITGGLNVYPAEVEAALCACAGVADAAVVGVADEVLGEAVTAFVVPRAGCEIDPARILAECRERIAGYKTPKRIHVIGDLPRTVSGKVRKQLLREQLNQQLSGVT